jgi:alpha-ribazole phosphatase
VSGTGDPIVLHLIRHGAPARPGRLLGRTDCPATPAGIVQCRQAAVGLEVKAIVSSDLARASVCASAIAEPRGFDVRSDPRGRELDVGSWDNSLPGDIDPDALARFWDDPDGCPPPDGERWSALVARVGQAIRAVGDATLVVTHGGAMRAALAVLCGLDARQVWAVDLPYAALLSLRVWLGEELTGQIVGLR